MEQKGKTNINTNFDFCIQQNDISKAREKYRLSQTKQNRGNWSPGALPRAECPEKSLGEKQEDARQKLEPPAGKEAEGKGGKGALGARAAGEARCPLEGTGCAAGPSPAPSRTTGDTQSQPHRLGSRDQGVWGECVDCPLPAGLNRSFCYPCRCAMCC